MVSATYEVSVLVSKGHNCLPYGLLLNYGRRWKAVPRSAPAKEVMLCFRLTLLCVGGNWFSFCSNSAA